MNFELSKKQQVSQQLPIVGGGKSALPAPVAVPDADTPAAIISMQRANNEAVPTLGGIARKGYDVKRLIAKAVIKMVKITAINTAFNSDSALAVADDLMSSFPWLTMPDVRLVLRRGRSGYYGKLLTINTTIINDWFRQYADERMSAAEAASIDSHNALGRVKISDEALANMYKSSVYKGRELPGMSLNSNDDRELAESHPDTWQAVYDAERLEREGARQREELKRYMAAMGQETAQFSHECPDGV